MVRKLAGGDDAPVGAGFAEVKDARPHGHRVEDLLEARFGTRDPLAIAVGPALRDLPVADHVCRWFGEIENAAAHAAIEGLHIAGDKARGGAARHLDAAEAR